MIVAMKRLLWRALFLPGTLSILSGCASGPKPAVAVYRQPYPSSYHDPIVSPGTKFAALPPAVQNTIRAETGSADIADVIKDTHLPVTVYRVYFVNYQAFPPLYIARDGSLLNGDLSVAIGADEESGGILIGEGKNGLTLSDLPPNVVKVIQKQVPDAEVAAIARETHGDQTVYSVSFKDAQHPVLQINGDGVLLKK
jgi:hypothetical protein